MKINIFERVHFSQHASNEDVLPVLALCDPEGIKLGEKLIASATEANLSTQSIAQIVASIPDDALRAWVNHNTTVPELKNHFSGKEILVRDASPDSCIALAVICLRLLGREIDIRWLNYATLWQQGETTLTGSVFQSFGDHLSALTHTEYHNWQGGQESYGSHTAKAIQIGLQFTLALMGQGASPFDLQSIDKNSYSDDLKSLYVKSTSRLQYEETIYKQISHSSTKVQLAVHLSDTGRKTLIDCILFSDATNTSSLKNFTRRDSESYLGSGYAMQALYRSQIGHKGTGRDFTISVDPQQGISLWRLWQELEIREEAAWAAFAETDDGFARPRSNEPDHNRKLVSYERDDCPVLPSLQPWWDGGEGQTILGAPRSVLHQGTMLPASRLNWSDIKQAIWHCYAPTLGLRVKPRGSGGLSFKLTGKDAHNKALRQRLNAYTDIYICDLERSEAHSDHSSIWTPTLLAALADFAERGDSSIDTLPAKADFDVVQEREGIVVITAHGLLLLDLSQGDSFPVDDMRKVAAEIALSLQAAQELEKDIAQQLRDMVRTAISDENEQRKRDALKAIYTARLTAQETTDHARKHENNDFIRRIKRLCDDRWQATKRYNDALEELSELEAMLLSSSEVRANMLLNKLAIYGLPMSLAGNLLGGLVLLSGPKYDGIAWPILLAYVAICVTGIGVLLLMQANARRKWQLGK